MEEVAYTKESLLQAKKDYVRRILDPKDNMDLEMISRDKFILNMKFYYPIIIELGSFPE